jgi:hypothetical protein
LLSPATGLGPDEALAKIEKSHVDCVYALAEAG